MPVIKLQRERIFCDQISVKVPQSVATKFAFSKKDEYFEANFKISKTTTFKELKEMCCKYWDLEMSKHSLYDHNFAHLMDMNKDKNHL
jgi:hypothetical protein